MTKPSNTEDLCSLDELEAFASRQFRKFATRAEDKTEFFANQVENAERARNFLHDILEIKQMRDGKLRPAKIRLPK